ncbi:MAG TPA: caspase family protein [Thermoanaerobaculia bacterium]|nr:caspase family protein [Thermoanaerobaculia bacterium]
MRKALRVIFPQFALMLILFPARDGLSQGFGFTLETQWSVPGGPVRELVFSPDGTWFLTTTGSRASVFGLSADGKAKEKVSITTRNEIQGAAISPDGKKIALVDGAGTLSLYESSSLQAPVTISHAHKGKASAVAFTDDGSYVVSGGEDGRVRIWTSRGQFFADLSRGAQHKGDVVLVAAIPGRKVISVGRDRQVILWQIDTQQALRPTRVENDVLSAAIGGDGKTLVLGLQLLTGNLFRSAKPDSLAHSIEADDRVRLMDAENGTQLRDFEGERQDLDTVGVTPDGRFVAAAGGGSDASVWDAATGKRINTIPFPEPVTALAFGPDGRWLLAGTKKGSLSLYRLSGVGPMVRPAAPATILVVIIEPTLLIDERAPGMPVPRVHSPSLRIRGKIKTGGTSLKSLLVGGEEITSLRPDEAGDYVFNAAVSVKEPGQHQIEIVAESEQGVVARRSFVVERTPETRAAVEALEPGRRIALIVGVSRYENPSINLQYAHSDAQALYDLLTHPSLGPAAFHKEDVQLLLDEQATVKNINKGVREFLRKARENDLVLFFFAGHGAPDPNQIRDLYLLAHDTDPENIAGTGILMQHVREAIAEIPARDVVILTDSCHSAGIAAPPNMRAVSANPIHKVFLEKMLHASGGLAILTASEAAQVSYENDEWGRHGVFTYYLLKALKGEADSDRDQIVTLGEAMEYVRDNVRNATKFRQIPAIGSTSFDRQLPLIIVDKRR